MDPSEIFSYFQKEKERKNLEKIPKDFYYKILDFMKKNKKQLEVYKSDTKEYMELVRNIENIKDTIFTLIMIRLSKIISMVQLEIKENLNIVDQNNLTEEEKVFYNIFKSLLKSYKENIINKILNGEEILIDRIYEDISKNVVVSAPKIDKNVILIKNELPKIIGPNGKVYGPFKSGDILIVNKSFAEKIESIKAGTKIL
ncbi:MAG: hypothetical protein ACP5G1_01525 [Nanopusillaceae archaeon]